MITTKIKQIKKVADGTTEVVFDRPEDFEFLAGQYIEVAVPELKYPDSKGASRVFSIASSCGENFVSIAFRDTGSGYKKTLIEMKEDSEVFLKKPAGFFTMPEDGEMKHVFIAGGIGVIPFLSMIRTMAEEGKNSKVSLLYGNRDMASSAYAKELRDLSSKSDNFSLDMIFGRIDDEHIQRHAEDVDNTLWWIVGPPAMVIEIKHLLRALGINDDKIRIEEFIGY